MPAVPRRRPWYFILAVLGAVGFGASGAWEGLRLAFLYRNSFDASVVAEQISDPADQQVFAERFQTYLQVLDAEKARGWPFAVAEMLIGAAVVAASVRTLRGSNGARIALVQLVVAQVGVYAVGQWALREVFDAQLQLDEAYQVQMHRKGTDRTQADQAVHAVAPFVRPISLAFQIVGGSLIVFGLTRRRVRAVMDPANAAVGEP